MEVKIDLYGFVTFLVDRTQKIKIKKVISKVIFDTRNPFKLPHKTFGWTGRTDGLTHTI